MITVGTRIPGTREGLERALKALVIMRQDLARHEQVLRQALMAHERASPDERLSLRLYDRWLVLDQVSSLDRQFGVMQWDSEVINGLHDWTGPSHRQFLAMAGEVHRRSAGSGAATEEAIQAVLWESFGRPG